jgi:hypothetical protein
MTHIPAGVFPCGSRFVLTGALPHAFSRLDPETRMKYREKYTHFKKYGSNSMVASIGLIEGEQLAKDIISLKPMLINLCLP